MNEARMYADGFETMFAKQEDFMAFLKQIGRVSSWDRRRSKDLRLIAFEADRKSQESCRSSMTEMGRILEFWRTPCRIQGCC